MRRTRISTSDHTFHPPAVQVEVVEGEYEAPDERIYTFKNFVINPHPSLIYNPAKGSWTCLVCGAVTYSRNAFTSSCSPRK